MTRPMGRLHEQTKQFLAFLRRAPQVRAQISAPKDGTLLYAGKLMRNAWEEIAELKDRGALAGLSTLPDVLARIAVPGTGHRSLLDYTQAVCKDVPWEDDGFIIWRALSGIFASQAQGCVSFYIGAGISPRHERRGAAPGVRCHRVACPGAQPGHRYADRRCAGVLPALPGEQKPRNELFLHWRG